ncbi:MAG: DUF1646 family protein [Archaeoglobaceae archaeon]
MQPAELIPEQPDPIVSAALFILLALVLILPFRVRWVEENLEPFFLVMGVISLLITSTVAPILTPELVIHALESPIGIVKIDGIPVLGIFQVVLIIGLIIHFYNRQIYSALVTFMQKVGLRFFVFFFVVFFGLISSVISVIVCSVILAEIALAMPLERRKKVEFIVIACFAVGMGAALTPVGEPLSTIAVRKLNADFFYLLRLIGHYIISGVLALGVYAVFRVGSSRVESVELPVYEETLRTVVVRAFRVYMFVTALELLGAGCTPLIVWYISKVPAEALYWINMVSAFLDNATLTAAEIGPTLTEQQIKSALMGLIISGGMLIPGNIPNIIAAARMKITMKDWARIGVPLGLVIMIVYFLIIHVLGL